MDARTGMRRLPTLNYCLFLTHEEKSKMIDWVLDPQPKDLSVLTYMESILHGGHGAVANFLDAVIAFVPRVYARDILSSLLRAIPVGYSEELKSALFEILDECHRLLHEILHSAAEHLSDISLNYLGRRKNTNRSPAQVTEEMSSEYQDQLLILKKIGEIISELLYPNKPASVYEQVMKAAQIHSKEKFHEISSHLLEFVQRRFQEMAHFEPLPL